MRSAEDAIFADLDGDRRLDVVSLLVGLGVSSSI